MKVEKIYVKNLRQIDEIETNFKWCTAIVTGGNNKGKSTLLRSIIERLRGDTTNIVKDWQKTWECERTFTDWSKLYREINEEKEKIEYTTKEGIKTSKIKEIVWFLFGKWFDIDVFLQSQPKEQKEILQKLVWIDFTEIDAIYNQAYEDRTNKNAIMKSEQAKISDMVIVECKEEKKDISEMQNVLIEIEKKNEQINSVESKMIDKKTRQKQLEEEIIRLQEENMNIIGEIEKWKNRLKENKKQDTQKIREEIEEQIKINDIHKNNEYVVTMQNSFENAKKEREDADQKVKKIEKEKNDMIKSAKMPQWFEFWDDCILFNWYKLDKSHLSSSQTYIAWLMLASMNMWEVETLTFDASYLDKNSLQQIENRANENNLQLLIERPDFDWWEIKYEIMCK